MSAMPYCSRLVGWLPLHVVLVFIKNSKCSKLSSLLVEFKLLVEDPNRQRRCVRPKVQHPNLVVYVVSTLWPGLLFLHSDPGWPSDPCLQQYVVLHWLW